MPRLALVFAIALLALFPSDTGRMDSPVPPRTAPTHAPAPPDTARTHGAGGDPAQWRFVSGRAPTSTEFVAVLAACKDGAIPRLRGKPLDACLADLGLRRLR